MTWGKAVLIAVDQLVNAALGGWPDETMSSRAWRWYVSGRRAWPRAIIDRLFFWEDDHCFASYTSEREGRQLPPELRNL